MHDQRGCLIDKHDSYRRVYDRINRCLRERKSTRLLIITRLNNIYITILVSIYPFYQSAVEFGIIKLEQLTNATHHPVFRRKFIVRSILLQE